MSIEIESKDVDVRKIMAEIRERIAETRDFPVEQTGAPSFIP